MHSYRLEPRTDTNTPDWRTTVLKEKCWILANSEHDARLKTALSTSIAIELKGQPLPGSPWQRAELTECVPESVPGRTPPEGVILTASGKTITVAGAKRS